MLVALDVSVEEAALRALQAQAKLAETTLERSERLLASGAIAREAVDQARAQRDVARAQAARVSAIIARKTIIAPFRARVGLADVHPGQYHDPGLQGRTTFSARDARLDRSRSTGGARSCAG